MTGIAETIELDFSTFFTVSYIMELSSFCTSIVAKLQNGTIIHERNLDFPLGLDI
jgi:hypothetical protein